MTKGDETRQSVLDAAIGMAAAEGLAGVTIGRLAERVGMSKSGLFAHFASKENLDVGILREASDRFVSQVISPALKAPRGEPRVVALFEKWLAWENSLPGGCVFVVASVELDDKPGPARDVLVSSQKDWIEAVAHAVRIAMDEKHFRKTLDAHQFAHEFYCMGFGHHTVARLIRDPLAVKRTRAAFERLLADARAAR